MTETPGDGTVELQIEEVVEVAAGQAVVTVRCLRGPVFLEAGFTRLIPQLPRAERHSPPPTGPATAIDLKLTKIVRYRELRGLDAVHTALVTLRGPGVEQLRSATRDFGCQIVQGTNTARERRKGNP
ncbi:hypothetical protein VSH64_20445 [Amycolatopsis rhabdoformis]|uniref:STAS domain-containing protein n=1 Tax=Amycolatopsis rhabdoformis TaxID=1448059 RepID=A0ABZ1IKW2_9PSEU|nr:hypothetical protein [Amycolatopsis rhabdoformis]WSE34428.1 hypothetical protein VSH64_20445 [Amycolatopsis rhabdoformis]